MNAYVISLIRTYVPVVVGAVVSWLAARGLHVDTSETAAATAILTALVTAAYYAAARALEQKFPILGGVLLGHTSKPVYVKPGAVTPPAAPVPPKSS